MADDDQMEAPQADAERAGRVVRRSRAYAAGLVVSVALLAAVVVFAVRHVGDANRFVALLEQAEPWWVVVAVACQVGTYVFTGAIWGLVAATAGYPLRMSQLARLAVEKLSMDHLVPTGGLAGNVVIIGAMQRQGVPASVATEALIIDVLAYFGAYGAAAAVAVLIIHGQVEIPQSITTILILFCAVLGGVPLFIFWALAHRDWTPGPRLSRFRWVMDLRDAVAGVSVKRVRNPMLLIAAALLHFIVFAMDAATVWMMLNALGLPATPSFCFAALIIASISATISFLPGGVGSFEGGAIATLALLGVSMEGALSATLMFRGIALWLPLLPGVVLTRRDLSWWTSPEEPS